MIFVLSIMHKNEEKNSQKHACLSLQVGEKILFFSLNKNGSKGSGIRINSYAKGKYSYLDFFNVC